MKIKDLRGLFESGLTYVYDCEQKLVEKGIPTMIEAASSPELRNALEQHLQETRTHVTRLEQVFNLLGAEPKTEDNDIIDAIMDSAENMTKATEEGSPLRDAALIVGGNLVEHYEIAAYGSLATFARQLGLSHAVTLLEQTLNEEKAADAKLTQLGQGSVNPKASQELRAA
jgi:ferritin-like metal-binding protein YciE